MTEDLPQRPINPYGESKLMFEKALIWYQQIHKLEFIAFRYFNAAGASEKFGEHHRIETHLIPNVLKVALGQFTPPLAVNLMVSCRIAGVRMEDTVRWVGPMLLAMFLVMVLVIVFPELALWLPRSLGY